MVRKSRIEYMGKGRRSCWSTARGASICTGALSSASLPRKPQRLGTQARRPVSSSPSVLDGDPVVDPHHTGGKPCDPLGFLALGPRADRSAHDHLTAVGLDSD